jgi:hypothetical protein
MVVLVFEGIQRMRQQMTARQQPGDRGDDGVQQQRQVATAEGSV